MASIVDEVKQFWSSVIVHLAELKQRLHSQLVLGMGRKLQAILKPWALRRNGHYVEDYGRGGKAGHPTKIHQFTSTRDILTKTSAKWTLTNLLYKVQPVILILVS